VQWATPWTLPQRAEGVVRGGYGRSQRGPPGGTTLSGLSLGGVGRRGRIAARGLWRKGPGGGGGRWELIKAEAKGDFVAGRHEA